MLEALGIGIELGPDDVAVRCNFCTVDERGRLTDRRAGRIPSAESEPLVEQLAAITVDGAEVRVEPVQDYRFVVVFSGGRAGRSVRDTDPQRTRSRTTRTRRKGSGFGRYCQVAEQFIACGA